MGERLPEYEEGQAPGATPPAGETVFTDEEAALISERLQSMGYIE